MKISRAKFTIIISILVILIVSVVFLHYFLSMNGERKHHPLIAIYPTNVSGHHPVHNTEQFLADLILVKDLGFEGVRLHPVDYDDYGYRKVAEDLEDLGLKFVMVIEFNITDNVELFNQNINYFCNVAQELIDKPNLLWYALKYPYDWTRPYTQMEEPNYRFQLQTMIDEIHETDPNHKIFLISGMIDTVATPPTDLENIDGFGIQPYSRDGQVDKLDAERIDWIEKYRATGKEVYIAEWGVQTLENSPNRKYDYGLVSNESMKVEMIKDFLHYINNWDIYWTYFGLHDYIDENSDWGIVYNDNSLKPSGVTFKKILTNLK